MISYIEQQPGNAAIVNEQGSRTYLPTGPEWRLLGWDRETLAFLYPNGQVAFFNQQGELLRYHYIAPYQRPLNYTEGHLFYHDERLGLDYRYSLRDNTNRQMGL